MSIGVAVVVIAVVVVAVLAIRALGKSDSSSSTTPSVVPVEKQPEAQKSEHGTEQK